MENKQFFHHLDYTWNPFLVDFSPESLHKFTKSLIHSGREILRFSHCVFRISANWIFVQINPLFPSPNYLSHNSISNALIAINIHIGSIMKFHSVKKREIHSHRKNISWNQLFSIFFCKNVDFTNILTKVWE